MVMEQVQNASDNNATDVQNESSHWVKFSESKLISLEKRILQVVQSAYKGWHVLIDHKSETKARIWTIAMNEESKNVPLVMLHGFGAGVGFWCMNLDTLAAQRPVYAIDLLGFGRSSRPDFHRDPLEAEDEFIESIESWRRAVKLDRFVLLGHSMGGYLATGYAIKYPDQVQHLILADPWGFAEKTAAGKAQTRPVSLKLRALAVVMYPLTALNPLAPVRAAGPFGPWLVKKMRADITHKYGAKLEDPAVISEYIYHCNAQKPTGETAFHQMIRGFGWAKHPMIRRVHTLDAKVPITIVNGSETWMDKTIGPQLQQLRKGSYVRCEVITGGHHIHADNPDEFNSIVVDTCRIAETVTDLSALRNKSLVANVSQANAEESDEAISDTELTTK